MSKSSRQMVGHYRVTPHLSSDECDCFYYSVSCSSAPLWSETDTDFTYQEEHFRWLMRTSGCSL